jgi:OOP family OmpA-OmpF porin
MINKSPLWSLLLTVLMFIGATGAPAADDPAWYVGAGVGRTDVKRASSWASQTDAALSTSGVTSTTLVDSHDTAWKLFGGYQFNEFIAAEAGFYRLGDFNGVTSISAPAPASVVGGSWDAKAVSISAVATYPIVNRFGLLFKAGLAASRLEVNVSAPTGFSRSETRVQPLLGLGVKFDVTKNIGLRGEFERFVNVGDGSTTGQSSLNVWSASALYRF